MNVAVTEYSVSALSLALKKILEKNFFDVKIRGEISGYKGPHTSGHAYFSLKDTGSKIDAIIWKGILRQLKVCPEDGMEVVVTGKITTYKGSSKYQVIVERMDYAGTGALLVVLEERKKKLASEGLFDPTKKKLLPFLPKIIGVITSPTGAVIRDILHRVKDRFPLKVLLWPVRVQGEGSSKDVTNAVNGFNQFQKHDTILPRPDLLIIARGGGSIEDLWGFNDEVLVRAVAASHIPIISAIGHETDWTLIDCVSDVRAPTPTGAAEMAVPVKSQLDIQIALLGQRLLQSCGRLTTLKLKELHNLKRLMPTSDFLFSGCWHRLDELAILCAKVFENVYYIKLKKYQTVLQKKSPLLLTQALIEKKQKIYVLTNAKKFLIKEYSCRNKEMLAGLSNRLNQLSLVYWLAEKKRNLAQMSSQIENLFVQKVMLFAEQLRGLIRLHKSLSYEQILERGFTLVINKQGIPITKAQQALKEKEFTVKFQDRSLDVSVLKKKKMKSKNQGLTPTLFGYDKC